MKRFFVVTFIAVALVLAATSNARPNVHFCNSTVTPIGVTLYDAEQFTPRYTIAAGQCTTPLPYIRDMTSLYMFYAPSSQDETWLGPAQTQSIQLPNGAWRPFTKIETGRDDITVTFTALDAALIF